MEKIAITWVTKWIWKALCQKFLNEWHTVIWISSNQANLDLLKQEVSHTALTLLKCDITNADDLRLFREYIIKHKINSLINNVWVWYHSTFIEYPNDQIEQIINTNMIWTLKVTQIALQECIWVLKNVTFISSLTWKIGFDWLSVYSATKHWIEGFSEALREELKESWIRVSIIRPWIVDTNFFSIAKMENYTTWLKSKMHSPEYVADKVYANWERKWSELTIWKDKRFLFLKRFVPKSRERKLLSYFTS